VNEARGELQRVHHLWAPFPEVLSPPPPPSLELQVNLEVSNPSPHTAQAFKVMATDPTRYFVSPAQTWVPAGGGERRPCLSIYT
jgi:hypothetical protein